MGSSSRRDYEPIFRTVLWKLMQGADGRKKERWFAREMWISINFNFVYYSVRDEMDLIYYSNQDLERATIVRLPAGDMLMPWAFQLVIPPQGGVVFAPGVFAAVSEEARERWIQEFQVQQVRSSGMIQVGASTLRDIYQTAGGPAIMEKAVRGDYRQLKELADASIASRREPEAEPASPPSPRQDDEREKEDREEEDQDLTAASNNEKSKKSKVKSKAKGKNAGKPRKTDTPQDAKKVGTAAAAGDVKNAAVKPATGKNNGAKKRESTA